MKARDAAEHDHYRAQACFEKLDVGLVVDTGSHHSAPEMEKLPERLLLHLEAQIITRHGNTNTRVGPVENPVAIENVGVLHREDIHR